MSATPAWLAAIEGVLNRNIGTQTRGQQLARRLDRKTLQIELEGVIALRAVCVAGRICLGVGEDAPADAAISGPPGALLRMMTAEHDRPLGKGSMQVRGDAEVAASYRELLELARPDPEEEAARILGDLPARRLGRLARGTGDWLRRAGRTFGENLAEYLQEESRDLATKAEVEEFVRAVDDLREAADRAEARARRLERGGPRGPGVRR
ncbi:MAG: SCP2 sterol-binding domain-containing protein [Gammaproteobacteria bacterium]|nr:SCP2 sterol-binding domain-containing protein [Gammaproteobacteria bacterium]